MIQIFIEGTEVDIDAESVKIATTKQHFEFLAIGSANGGLVKASRINRISLPLTSKNKTLLEQVAPLSVIGSKVRENLDINIVDGVSVLPVGVCQIVSIQERIELDAQSTEKNFFDALEGKYLNDLNLSTWNGLWDDNRRDTVRTAASGLVSPVVHTGQFVNDIPNNCLDIYTHGRANVPFIWYKTIFEKILALAGYTLSADSGYNNFISNDQYNDTAMSTRFVYNEVWIAAKEFIATNPGSQVVPSDTIPPFAPASTPLVDFTAKTGDADGFMNLGTDIWTVNNPDTALEYFKGLLKFQCTQSKDAAFQLLVNGVNTGTTTYNNGICTIETGIIEFKHGDTVKVQCFNIVSAGNLTISNAKLQLKVVNTTETELAMNTDWYIYFNQLLPRIPLKTFVLDMMIMNGLVMKERNGELFFRGIKELIQENVLTITSSELAKVDTSIKPKVTYAPTGFAKTNEYRWLIQADEPIITADWGKGAIVIDNDQLPDLVTRYTSIFTGSDTNYVVRINQCADFPIYEQTTPTFTKAASFGSRLVVLRGDDGVNVRFKAGTSRTDYWIGYFIDPNQAFSLDWTQIKANEYSEFERVLNNLAIVEENHFLTLAEFCNVDLFIAKYKQGLLFIIESITNYVPGLSTVFKKIRI